MNREPQGRHEARPTFCTDREQNRARATEKVATLYRGRHRA